MFFLPIEVKTKHHKDALQNGILKTDLFSHRNNRRNWRVTQSRGELEKRFCQARGPSSPGTVVKSPNNCASYAFFS